MLLCYALIMLTTGDVLMLLRYCYRLRHAAAVYAPRHDVYILTITEARCRRHYGRCFIDIRYRHARFRADSVFDDLRLRRARLPRRHCAHGFRHATLLRAIRYAP